MCEGDKEAACVLHLIDDGIDTGQILQVSSWIVTAAKKCVELVP